MMKQTLTSAEFEESTEPEVERWLAVEQRELMRRMYQAFFTLRGEAQAEEPVIGRDGRMHTQQREGERKLESVFGTVAVERTGHTGEGRRTLYPVDVLNVNYTSPFSDNYTSPWG